MESLEVTAKFNEDGKITPIRFTWDGIDYLVESTGRQWEASDGEHILVMVPGGRIFELVFNSTKRRWFLSRVEPGQMAA
jgi:hypothetical protein